jgi:hypothetical protein
VPNSTPMSTRKFQVILGESVGQVRRYCRHKIEAVFATGERMIPVSEWKSLKIISGGSLIEASQLPQKPLVESGHALESLLAEATKGHYPFKRKKKLGPAVRGGTNKKAGKWDCDCENDGSQTVCQCDDLTGETDGRIVKIPLSYKREYNKDYRAWLKKKAAKGGKGKSGGAKKAA